LFLDDSWLERVGSIRSTLSLNAVEGSRIMDPLRNGQVFNLGDILSTLAVSNSFCHVFSGCNIDINMDLMQCRPIWLSIISSRIMQQWE
jgi:hypothetical protein